MGVWGKAPKLYKILLNFKELNLITMANLRCLIISYVRWEGNTYGRKVCLIFAAMVATHYKIQNHHTTVLGDTSTTAIRIRTQYGYVLTHTLQKWCKLTSTLYNILVYPKSPPFYGRLKNFNN